MGEVPGESPRQYSRRRLLLTGAAAAAGGAAAVAVGGGAVLANGGTTASEPANPATPGPAQGVGTDAVGSATVPFHGPHQAGIGTPAQAFATFCAFDLREGVDADRLAKLLKILTDDLTRITAGRPALGDTAPELASSPARLTVTIGFGPALFDKVGRATPDRPGSPTCRRSRRSTGSKSVIAAADLLLQIGADDPITVAHAQRMLLKDTRAFATIRWVQRGFLRARGSGAEGSTPRNVMGQVDGTVNPTDRRRDGLRRVASRARVVRRRHHDGAPPHPDGHERWDELDRSAMETTIGRRLSNGAPLTGVDEHDEPDLTATDATGLLAIADFAHLRLARGDGPAPQILRRPYNYDESPGADGDSDVGQIFCSYQASIEKQFIPMQQRLAAGDLLNQWITPIGSAVFAIPPGLPTRRVHRRGAPVMIRSSQRSSGSFAGGGPARRSVIVVVLMVLLAAIFAAAAPAASAHNLLVSSSPAADSVLPEAPGSIELVFDQDIKDFQPKIAITITGHDPIEITPAIDGPTVTADLSTAELPAWRAGDSPVSWRVGYRVVSADGHPVTGLLNFSVGSGPAPTIDAGDQSPTAAAAAASDAATTDNGSVRWWIIGGGLLLIGAVIALTWAVRQRRRAGLGTP